MIFHLGVVIFVAWRELLAKKAMQFVTNNEDFAYQYESFVDPIIIFWKTYRFMHQLIQHQVDNDIEQTNN